jgi:hypothetical protein
MEMVGINCRKFLNGRGKRQKLSGQLHDCILQTACGIEGQPWRNPEARSPADNPGVYLKVLQKCWI